MDLCKLHRHTRKVANKLPRIKFELNDSRCLWIIFENEKKKKVEDNRWRIDCGIRGEKVCLNLIRAVSLELELRKLKNFDWTWLSDNLS